MIRTIIADDESLVRENIRLRLQEHAKFSIIEECRTGSETLDKINQYKPDLLFLDIQMPGLTGLEVLNKLDDIGDLQVIFVTAYDEYAIKAFEVNAVDYLLKPIDSDRFNEALKRVQKNINALDSKKLKKLVRTLASTQEAIDQPNIPRRVRVKSNGRIRFIPISEITYLEAAGDYVELHISGSKKTHLKRVTMKQMAKELASDFIRIHRSYLVKKDEILEFIISDNDRWSVVLNDDTKLTVSSGYRSKLKQMADTAF